MSPGLRGVFQLMKKVAQGIVPGLKLLLFLHPKLSHDELFNDFYGVFSGSTVVPLALDKHRRYYLYLMAKHDFKLLET